MTVMENFGASFKGPRPLEGKIAFLTQPNWLKVSTFFSRGKWKRMKVRVMVLSVAPFWQQARAQGSSGEIVTFLIHRNSHTDIVTVAQTEPLAKWPTAILLHFRFFCLHRSCPHVFHGRRGVRPVSVRVIQLPSALNLSVNSCPSLIFCSAMSRVTVRVRVDHLFRVYPASRLYRNSLKGKVVGWWIAGWINVFIWGLHALLCKVVIQQANLQITFLVEHNGIRSS